MDDAGNAKVCTPMKSNNSILEASFSEAILSSLDYTVLHDMSIDHTVLADVSFEYSQQSKDGKIYMKDHPLLAAIENYIVGQGLRLLEKFEEGDDSSAFSCDSDDDDFTNGGSVVDTSVVSKQSNLEKKYTPKGASKGHRFLRVPLQSFASYYTNNNDDSIAQTPAPSKIHKTPKDGISVAESEASIEQTKNRWRLFPTSQTPKASTTTAFEATGNPSPPLEPGKSRRASLVETMFIKVAVDDQGRPIFVKFPPRSPKVRENYSLRNETATTNHKASDSAQDSKVPNASSVEKSGIFSKPKSPISPRNLKATTSPVKPNKLLSNPGSNHHKKNASSVEKSGILFRSKSSTSPRNMKARSPVKANKPPTNRGSNHHKKEMEKTRSPNNQSVATASLATDSLAPRNAASPNTPKSYQVSKLFSSGSEEETEIVFGESEEHDDENDDHLWGNPSLWERWIPMDTDNQSYFQALERSKKANGTEPGEKEKCVVQTHEPNKTANGTAQRKNEKGFVQSGETSKVANCIEQRDEKNNVVQEKAPSLNEEGIEVAEISGVSDHSDVETSSKVAAFSSQAESKIELHPSAPVKKCPSILMHLNSPIVVSHQPIIPRFKSPPTSVKSSGKSTKRQSSERTTPRSPSNKVQGGYSSHVIKPPLCSKCSCALNTSVPLDESPKPELLSEVDWETGVFPTATKKTRKGVVTFKRTESKEDVTKADHREGGALAEKCEDLTFHAQKGNDVTMTETADVVDGALDVNSDPGASVDNADTAVIQTLQNPHIIGKQEETQEASQGTPFAARSELSQKQAIKVDAQSRECTSREVKAWKTNDKNIEASTNILISWVDGDGEEIELVREPTPRSPRRSFWKNRPGRLMLIRGDDDSRPPAADETPVVESTVKGGFQTCNSIIPVTESTVAVEPRLSKRDDSLLETDPKKNESANFVFPDNATAHKSLLPLPGVMSNVLKPRSFGSIKRIRSYFQTVEKQGPVHSMHQTFGKSQSLEGRRTLESQNHGGNMQSLIALSSSATDKSSPRPGRKYVFGKKEAFAESREELATRRVTEESRERACPNDSDIKIERSKVSTRKGSRNVDNELSTANQNSRNSSEIGTIAKQQTIRQVLLETEGEVHDVQRRALVESPVPFYPFLDCNPCRDECRDKDSQDAKTVTIISKKTRSLVDKRNNAKKAKSFGNSGFAVKRENVAIEKTTAVKSSSNHSIKNTDLNTSTESNEKKSTNNAERINSTSHQEGIQRSKPSSSLKKVFQRFAKNQVSFKDDHTHNVQKAASTSAPSNSAFVATTTELILPITLPDIRNPHSGDRAKMIECSVGPTKPEVEKNDGKRPQRSVTVETMKRDQLKNQNKVIGKTERNESTQRMPLPSKTKASSALSESADEIKRVQAKALPKKKSIKSIVTTEIEADSPNRRKVSQPLQPKTSADQKLDKRAVKLAEIYTEYKYKKDRQKAKRNNDADSNDERVTHQARGDETIATGITKVSALSSSSRLTAAEKKLAHRLANDVKILAKIEAKRRKIGRSRSERKSIDIEKSLKLLQSIKASRQCREAENKKTDSANNQETSETEYPATASMSQGPYQTMTGLLGGFSMFPKHEDQRATE